MVMGVDTVGADFAELDQAAQDLEALSRALQGQLDQMRGDVAKLKAFWVASGSTAAAQWDVADQDIQALIDGLSAYAKDFSGRTTVALETHRRGEAQRQSMFG